MTDPDLSEAFDVLPAAFAVLSPDLVYVRVNQAYEQLVERPRDRLLGRRLEEVFPGGPGGHGVRDLRMSMERVLSEGDTDVMPLVRYDVEDPDKPGTFTERYWTAVNVPLLGPDGRVAWVINRVEEVTAYLRQLRTTDATAARSSAVQVEAAEAELFARAQDLEEANRQLRTTRAHARRTAAATRTQLREQRQIVADTSHDLRGPLTGLQTRLQLALADPDSDTREVLQAVLQDAERLGDVVSDLLELARLESDPSISTEPVDLSALVEIELARCAPDSVIITDISPGVMIDGSANRLTRLFGNLVMNADRHAKSQIEVKVSASDGDALVEVIDDGPGIPEQEREAVFQRFYRRADARRSDPGGTGLGLPIARQVARAHHGDLVITDPPAEYRSGTRLALRLPLRSTPRP